MVSRENVVVLVSMVVALPVTYLVYAFADLPFWAELLVLVGLGVVVPTLVNDYLDRQASG